MPNSHFDSIKLIPAFASQKICRSYHEPGVVLAYRDIAVTNETMTSLLGLCSPEKWRSLTMNK